MSHQGVWTYLRVALLFGLVGCGYGAEGSDVKDGPVASGESLTSPEGTCTEAGRFTATESLVYDRTTPNLVWQRRVSARLSHPEATRYCEGIEIEGLRGFRLPKAQELNGIRFHPGGLFGTGVRYCIPCIDQVAFPDTPSGLFWTSRALNDGTAFYVGFDDGRSHRDVQTDALWVRCVHDR